MRAGRVGWRGVKRKGRGRREREDTRRKRKGKKRIDLLLHASTYLSVFTEYTFQVLVLTATFGRSKSEFNFVYS